MKTLSNTDYKENLTANYIKLITKNDDMTTKIMSHLYPNNPKYKFLKCEDGHFYKVDKHKCPYCIDKIVEVDKPHVVDQYKSDKHKEIVDSLDYLKSKVTKTKQDKESIHTLEVILKNFS